MRGDKRWVLIEYYVFNLACHYEERSDVVICKLKSVQNDNKTYLLTNVKINFLRLIPFIYKLFQVLTWLKVHAGMQFYNPKIFY